MANEIQSDNNSRFTDIFNEPIDQLLSPIKGYEEKAIVSLMETIKPISSFFDEIEDNIFVALHNCQSPIDGLNQQESASIHLYTMHFNSGPSLYRLLNQALRAENRDELKPWFSYLKLFLTALYKLPSQTGTIWRGIRNVDLSSKYKTGTKFAWWGVSSCTMNIEVLESKAFFGKTGLRTLFSIECIHGKSVSNHSYYKSREQEIILMPGSYFQVMGQLNPTPELYIIHLKEILPPITLVKPPFDKTDSTGSGSPSPTVIKKPPILFPKPKLNLLKQTPSIESTTKDIAEIPKMKWQQMGITIAGGNGRGDQLNQLDNPKGIFIDDDEQILYIVDSSNHRIIRWKFNASIGKIVVGRNRKGYEMKQLNHPTDIIIDKKNNAFIISDYGYGRILRWSCEKNTKRGEIIIPDIWCYGLAMDKNENLYVVDNAMNEVRRWENEESMGQIVAGGNEEGDDLNQLNSPTYIFVDEKESLYISDTNNHRIIKWMKGAEQGVVAAGGNGSGNSLRQLSSPRGLIVDHLGHIYVADYDNDRVMRWCDEDKEGTIVIGGNGKGQESNQLNGPHSLAFDRDQNLYVVDSLNDRIQKFEFDSVILTL